MASVFDPPEQPEDDLALFVCDGEDGCTLEFEVRGRADLNFGEGGSLDFEADDGSEGDCPRCGSEDTALEKILYIGNAGRE